MRRGVTVYLNDILECIARIQEYTQGLDLDDFLDDMRLQDAVARRLEIIGEAAKGIPRDVRDHWPDVRWAAITGLRDILIHGYFRVNLPRVWAVVTEDLPVLQAQVEEILADPGHD